VLVDEMVARIVTVSDKQVEVNEFPRVVEDASKGLEPIKEYYLRLNQEVYQSRYLTSVPVEGVSGLAFVRKYEQLIQQSADIFGMTNVFLLRFRESLILEKYEPVGAKQCLPFPSLYPTMNMKTCATSQIAASLENFKVCLHKKIVKHDMASQGPYGYCLKRLHMSNWCWAYMKHHLLHHNQLVVEEFNSERNKGSIRYHFTLEASRLNLPQVCLCPRCAKLYSRHCYHHTFVDPATMDVYTDHKDELEADLNKDVDLATIRVHSTIAHSDPLVATEGCMNPHSINFMLEEDDDNEVADLYDLLLTELELRQLDAGDKQDEMRERLREHLEREKGLEEIVDLINHSSDNLKALVPTTKSIPYILNSDIGIAIKILTMIFSTVIDTPETKAV
jgi:hypothetical protein